ncbi:MAG: hypothetical protein M5U28_26395 [Sandaracinaceae bacterium]|nr:hypothetical protein [Sandaracinaceae bacterium]
MRPVCRTSARSSHSPSGTNPVLRTGRAAASRAGRTTSAPSSMETLAPFVPVTEMGLAPLAQARTVISTSRSPDTSTRAPRSVRSTRGHSSAPSSTTQLASQAALSPTAISGSQSGPPGAASTSTTSGCPITGWPNATSCAHPESSAASAHVARAITRGDASVRGARRARPRSPSARPLRCDRPRTP